ncbi:signal peptidase I [Halobellus salinisoli]|uniref:signal peptidase I n=1 Tax=Halobellus salinisoli TaxID=3108500 RepID=UPI003009FB34
MVSASDAVQWVILIVVLLAAGSLVFGQLLGQPILLAYVETGSMSPTMEPGDGFVAIPSAIADPPEEGDVVTFDAQELQGGGLTTHRVVGRTDAGYVTQGDANPFSDQDGEEPPVQRSQIVAHALQVNGEVVVIPNLGTGVLAIQSVLTGVLSATGSLPGIRAFTSGEFSAQALVWAGGGIIVVSFLLDTFGSSRATSQRSRRRGDYIENVTVVLVVLAVVLVPATASMALSSGTTTFDVVSSQSPTDDPFVIATGDTDSINYSVYNDGYVPMLTVVEPGHHSIEVSEPVHYVSPRSNTSMQLFVTAPPETGAYERSVSQSRYLPILPRGLILSLHGVHPWLAIAAIDGILLVGTLALSVLTIGFSPVRLRSTARNISLLDRLRRRFR